MDGGVGHGRSLASGRSRRIGSRGRIAATMHALILADGDAPSRHDLDAAWPGWDRAIGLVIAADGGARHADALGMSIDVWVGDGDSIEPALLDALEARGRPARTEPSGQGRVRHRAGGARGAAPGSRRASSSSAPWAAPRIDHGLANIGLLALPALERPAGGADRCAIADLADSRARPGRRAGRAGAGRARGRHRLAAAGRPGCRRGHHGRPGLSVDRRAAPRGSGSWPLERPGDGDGEGHAPGGSAAGRGIPC